MATAAPQTLGAKFEWANPVFVGKADCARVHKELEKLKQASPDGIAKPDDIVDYAKAHPRSEMHKLFNWDEAEAARAHWLHIARSIVRSIRIVYSDDAPEPMRVYVRPTDAGGYKRLDEIVSPNEITKLRKQAMGELKSWLARYEQIVRSIPGAKTVIDQMIEMLRVQL